MAFRVTVLAFDVYGFKTTNHVNDPHFKSNLSSLGLEPKPPPAWITFSNKCVVLQVIWEQDHN